MTVVLGDFLEVNTRRSACGFGQLSDVSDSDSKKLRGRFFSHNCSITQSQKGVQRRRSGACSGVEASAPSVSTEHYIWESLR